MSALTQLMMIAGVVGLAVAIASLVPAFTSDRPYQTDDDEHDNGPTDEDHAK